MKATGQDRLKRAHVILMQHPETALYSGIMMMGESTVIEDCPTAYTDGLNKRYGRAFVEKQTDAELRGLVMHENLHVALKHMSRFLPQFKKEPQLVNAGADYVVNDIIDSFEDKKHCQLPKGALLDKKYHNWSLNEVLRDLQKQQENGNPPPQSLDEHDFSGSGPEGGQPQPMTGDEQKAQDKKVDDALREGGLMASRFGSGKTPRAIGESLAPKVDWKTVLKDFVTSVTKGVDEYTWRKFNKRYLADDIYLPSTENDSVGEIVVAIDTSGSIGTSELNSFSSEVASICETCSPEKVRILWWDTEVHGEQVFTDNYQDIAKLLKPQGGGGTDVQCVADYITDKHINAEGILVFTDGWFNKPQWNVSSKTLWLVTSTEDYLPSTGIVVKQDSV